MRIFAILNSVWAMRPEYSEGRERFPAFDSIAAPDAISRIPVDVSDRELVGLVSYDPKVLMLRSAMLIEYFHNVLRKSSISDSWDDAVENFNAIKAAALEEKTDDGIREVVNTKLDEILKELRRSSSPISDISTVVDGYESPGLSGTTTPEAVSGRSTPIRVKVDIKQKIHELFAMEDAYAGHDALEKDIIGFVSEQKLKILRESHKTHMANVLKGRNRTESDADVGKNIKYDDSLHGESMLRMFYPQAPYMPRSDAQKGYDKYIKNKEAQAVRNTQQAELAKWGQSHLPRIRQSNIGNHPSGNDKGKAKQRSEAGRRSFL